MHTEKQPVSIFWFRRDLRTDDNHGLYEAFNSGLPVLPVFIFDTNILDQLEERSDKRVDFIHHHVSELKNTFEQKGSSLHVFHSTPAEAFEELVKTYHVRSVYANHDYEPYAIKRDNEIDAFLTRHGIKFYTFKDQVMFEKNEICKNDGSPYTIFTPYSKPWKAALKEQGIPHYASEKKLGNLFKIKKLPLPSLNSLGFKKTDVKAELVMPSRSVIQNYHDTRNIPSIAGTTHLSVHLRFGTVSLRKLVKAAQELNEQWLNELIWREFFMMILWHFPKVVNHCFKARYESIQWRNNEKEFKAWCEGKTGYPIVDAGMHELNTTGFMHNRVRMITASFLTKHLLIDWRWGEAYFAEKLLDYDLSANNGNWQWAAGCGCDSAPYFRIFNPTEQTKRFDPQLKYIKTWNDAGYEMMAPIVNHEMARKRCLEVYREALKE